MSDKVINIISEAFKVIPAGNHLVKQDSKKELRYKKLGEFIYKNAIRKNGLYLPKNGEGIAVCYEIDPKNDKQSFSDIINDIKFALNISGIKNALGIAKRQSYIKSQRPQDEKYMYWEFTAVDPEARGTATGTMGELRDYVYRDAHEKQLPIYAETSIRKNKIVYQRYGFDIYHEWTMPDGSTMWFMRYDTKNKPNPIEK